jgi:hypothetical protein
MRSVLFVRKLARTRGDSPAEYPTAVPRGAVCREAPGVDITRAIARA